MEYKRYMNDPRVKELMRNLSGPEAEYMRRRLKAIAFFESGNKHQFDLWIKLCSVSA